MPLNTMIIRNGEPLKLHWGNFHVAAMVLAVTFDTGQGPYMDNRPEKIVGEDYIPGTIVGISQATAFRLTSYPVIGTTVLNDGEYELVAGYTFMDTADGEILEFFPGDTLIAYRTMR